jgi:V/A-type H+-transporting ATPase subunit D
VRLAAERLAPTRLGLLHARRRLERVSKGVDLLRRKREALVGELFRVARPAADARRRIAERATRAYAALLAALAQHGRAGLRALAWPEREPRVEIRAGQVWGTPVADIVQRSPLARTFAARGAPPGAAGPAAALAAGEFEELADLLLDAAPRELLVLRLGEALARTSRQVNTLERRVAPALDAGLTAVRRALEEREREESVRLRRLLRRRHAAPAEDPRHPSKRG